MYCICNTGVEKIVEHASTTHMKFSDSILNYTQYGH